MAINTYNIASAKGGDAVVFTYDYADIAQKFTFDLNDWGLYTSTNVSVDDVLSPDNDSVSGLSLAGVWIGSVTTTQFVDPTTAYIRWTGTGSFTVAYTLNGTTWTNAANGDYIPLAGDEDFDIRVTFTGGILTDTSQVSSLRVWVLKSDKLFSTLGRSISYSGINLSENIGDQLNPRSDEGGVFLNGDYLDIAPDTLTGQTIKTVEFWAKMDSLSTTMYVLEENAANRLTVTSGVVSFPSAFTVEMDGVSKTTGYTVDANWHYYKLTFTSATNNNIRMGKGSAGANPAAMKVFGLAFYPTTTTNTYAYNIGLAAIRVDDTGFLTVTEPATPGDIYAYAWSIISAN